MLNVPPVVKSKRMQNVGISQTKRTGGQGVCHSACTQQPGRDELEWATPCTAKKINQGVPNYHRPMRCLSQTNILDLVAWEFSINWYTPAKRVVGSAASEQCMQVSHSCQSFDDC